VDMEENPINEFFTTLKLREVDIKGKPLLSNKLTNFITYGFTNAICNENYVITNSNFAPIPQECIIHELCCHVMFHVQNELKLLLGQFSQSSYLNVSFANESCMALNDKDH
jgi:hypothetical protein